MPELVPILLFGWVIASPLLWLVFPPRTAALVALVGGWAVLPTASFPEPAPGEGFPYWILGVALPAQFWLTKATSIGAGVALGMLVFDPKGLRGFRSHWIDAPVVVWCVCPLLAWLASSAQSSHGTVPGGVARAFADVGYLSLAWGIPYLAGRIYCGTPEGLRSAGAAVVAGGLAYLPVCLLEFFAGPRVYEWAYGYHPYALDGAARYVGYRPMGLLEHGNQLGMWLAGSAVVAAWLRRRRARESGGVADLPAGAVAGLLAAAAMLSQSVGAIALMVPAMLAAALHRWRRVVVVAAAGVLLLVASLVALRLTNAVNLRRLSIDTGVGRQARQLFRQTGRGSFGWRLKLDEQFASLATQHPIFGTGQWDWWDGKGTRPWGLWLLALGMYGLVGMAAVHLILLLPPAAALRRANADSAAPGVLPVIAGLGLLMFISVLDNLLNAWFVLPWLTAAGGLATYASQPAPADDLTEPVHVRRAENR